MQRHKVTPRCDDVGIVPVRSADHPREERITTQEFDSAT